MKKKWIQQAVKHRGALRQALGLKAGGRKITAAELERAQKSKSPLMRQRANLAETLKRLRKKKK